MSSEPRSQLGSTNVPSSAPGLTSRRARDDAAPTDLNVHTRPNWMSPVRNCRGTTSETYARAQPFARPKVIFPMHACRTKGDGRQPAMSASKGHCRRIGRFDGGLHLHSALRQQQPAPETIVSPGFGAQNSHSLGQSSGAPEVDRGSCSQHSANVLPVARCVSTRVGGSGCATRHAYEPDR